MTEYEQMIMNKVAALKAQGKNPHGELRAEAIEISLRYKEKNA